MTDTALSAADSVLRYAFSQGPGRDTVVPLGPLERRLTTSFGSLPSRVRADRVAELVWGTVDLLEDTAYPQVCPAGDLSCTERIQHALVMAFGLQRREPSNLFNDHRSSASVRSRFPVHAFVHTDHQGWLVDAYRHGLLPVDGADPCWPETASLGIALAGRYTHLPSPYGRLRGPLVELELGIGLRNLWVAFDVFGVTAHLDLPGSGAGRLMAQLGLDPPGEWSAPLSVALRGRGLGGLVAPPPAARPPVSGSQAGGPSAAGRPADGDDDPTLDEVIGVNRHALDAPTGGPDEPTRGGGSALPASVLSAATSWSDVLWRRTAGHMPRQLAGVSGRRRPVPATAVTDALAWLDVPPPTPLLREVARHLTVSAGIQDATGFATGWYRVTRLDEQPARLDLVRADPTLPAQLEECYGHGQKVDAGCAVRQANVTWLLSADVAALVDAFGPGGWTLAQYACGWMAHGLCLAAAAHDLFARPNRAFDEVLLHPVVGTRRGEMVLLSVVTGTSRFREPMLDLRT